MQERDGERQRNDTKELLYMKKKGLAMLVLTAAMSLGTAGITALAAGWAQEGSNWVYYDNNGSRAANVWRQAQDGTWRYLESSGAMAVNKWVDNDDYYVDASGIMVTNKWLQVANSYKTSGYDWYYFGSNGKCIKDKWQQIDGKYYHFGDTGIMETGWILDNMYYCDNVGVMVTGWQKLTPPEEYQDDEDNHNSPMDAVSDGMYWYYFGSNGKKTVPNENGTNVKQKKINGTYYCLREDGAVQTGWVCVTGDDSENIEEYRYVDADGKVRTGWYSIQPPEYLQGHYDHDVEWFYFNSKGVPEVGPAEGTAKASDLKRINGYTHLFNEYGTPVYGLQKVYTNSSEEEYSAYYFGSYPQSSMLKGKYNIDESGISWPYYFSSTGKGYTGVYDGYLYYMGRMQKADSGSKYEVFTIPTGNGEKNYVVSTSGKVAKNTTVKDSNGIKYKTNSSGILTKEDDESVDGGTYRTPEEPAWDND